MTEKRFLSAEERRERLATVSTESQIAAVAAASTMAGMPLSDHDIEGLRRKFNGETPKYPSRLAEIRAHLAATPKDDTDQTTTEPLS